MIAGIVPQGVKNGVCFQELQSIAMVVKALFEHLHCALLVSDMRVEHRLPTWPIGFTRVSLELLQPETLQAIFLERLYRPASWAGVPVFVLM